MTNINKNPNTDSLSLAAYFCSTGVDLVDVAKHPYGSQFVFYFDIPSEQFDELTSNFWSKKTVVDALSYFEALRILKSRIYQYKNKENYGAVSS